MNAQHIEYDKADSIAVEKILKNADENQMDVVGLAKLFLGKPYLPNSLDKGNEEHLIVNKRALFLSSFFHQFSPYKTLLFSGKIQKITRAFF